MRYLGRLTWFTTSVFLIGVFLAAGAGRVDAQESARIALVIGNSAYKFAPPLPNPANDAKLIAETLRGLGFDVIERIDADRETIQLATFELQDRLIAASEDSVGLFFYTGHGVQVGGENYLIPLGADIKKEREVAINSVSASFILKQMEFAENAMNFVILDACRNNPFPASTRATTRGLARMNAPTGSLVAYSTGPGEVAVDGLGDNSPYVLALSQAMQTPGVPAELMFKRVRESVLEATNKKQTPWEESSLMGGEFYFTPPRAALTALTPAVSAEALVWEAIKDSAIAADYQAYLTDYPNGVYASLARARVDNLTTATALRSGGDNRKLTPATSNSKEMEKIFWETIEDSDDPADFEDFLAKFPESLLAGIAGRRLKRLTAPQPATAVAALTTPATGESGVSGGPASFDDGGVVYTRGEYEAALNIWLPLAEQGDVDAQYYLGLMYNVGEGVAADNAEAVRWYRRAAEQGDPYAQDSLGTMYDFGEGVPVDDVEAVRWYRLSAEQNYVGAQYSLALMYDYGEGVALDYAEAVKWYRRAAEQDYAAAQYNLALMYAYGDGVPELPHPGGQPGIHAHDVRAIRGALRRTPGAVRACRVR